MLRAEKNHLHDYLRMALLLVQPEASWRPLRRALSSELASGVQGTPRNSFAVGGLDEDANQSRSINPFILDCRPG